MKEILKPSEAAALLRIKRRTLYELVARRIIPGIRIGRSLRFKRRDILELRSKKLVTRSNGDLDERLMGVSLGKKSDLQKHR